jgi:hypothetical protein
MSFSHLFFCGLVSHLFLLWNDIPLNESIIVSFSTHPLMTSWLLPSLVNYEKVYPKNSGADFGVNNFVFPQAIKDSTCCSTSSANVWLSHCSELCLF